MAKTAFIGLGVMGRPMAGHLLTNGHEVTVFNRTPEKAQKWVEEFGGQAKATPAEATSDADFVFACVGNDDDLRSVTLGENGVFSRMKEGAIFVDHTTVSAVVTRELADAAKERCIETLDAPVSGGQAGAENGKLSIMVGGDKDVFAKVLPVIRSYGSTIKYIGGTGAGQVAKMVNQICIAGVVQGLAEGLHFARTNDLNVEATIDVIAHGAAGSWQMINRYKTMMAGEYDHGFAVDWMRKDLGIILEQAKGSGASLPMTAFVDQLYAEVQAMGGGRWDTSSLLARLEQYKNSQDNCVEA